MSSALIEGLVKDYGVRALAEQWAAQGVSFETVHLLLLRAQPRKWVIAWGGAPAYNFCAPFPSNRPHYEIEAKPFKPLQRV